MNRFDCLTEKQKRLVTNLLRDPDFDVAAGKMGITRRSVYRLAANIRNRIARKRYLNVAVWPREEDRPTRKRSDDVHTPR